MIASVATENVGAAALTAAMATAFLYAGGTRLHDGLSSLHRGLVLWRSDPVEVRSAANQTGVVELLGTAEPAGETLESPFTAKECLCYEYQIDERRATQTGSEWETLERGRRGVPFRLVDDTGGVLVEPDGAVLDLLGGDTIRVGHGSTASGPIADFLEQSDVEPGAVSEWVVAGLLPRSGDRRRYREHRLDPGDAVHVRGPVERDLGAAEEAGDVHAAVRDGAGGARLLVSDTGEGASILGWIARGVVRTLVGLALVLVGLAIGSLSLAVLLV